MNRRLFENADLDLLLKLGDKHIADGNELTICVININNFKVINDTFGYFSGNNLLNQITESLREILKNFDYTIGKLCGDEFIILINNINESNSIKIINKIKIKLTEKFFYVDKELGSIRIACTVGMSYTNTKSIKTQQLLHMAYTNMSYNKYATQGVLLYENSNYILENTYKDLLEVLYEKDVYSFVHSQYVAHYSTSLAKYLKLSEQEIQEIALSSWLHDIGKILISNKILRKKGRLTDEEYDKIKFHVIAGISVLSSYDISQSVLNGIKYHHERWDRKGYPFGISGNDTPFYARIIQIADSFSAMTIKRVYREKMDIKKALKEIEKCKESQFDPLLADKFIEMIENK